MKKKEENEKIKIGKAEKKEKNAKGKNSGDKGAFVRTNKLIMSQKKMILWC